jgi:hypothetical protein
MSQISGLLPPGGGAKSPSRAPIGDLSARGEGEASADSPASSVESLLPHIGDVVSPALVQAMGQFGGLLSSTKPRIVKLPSLATPHQLEHVMQGKSLEDLP